MLTPRNLWAPAALAVSVTAAPAFAGSIQLNLLGTYESGLYNQSAAEIPAYDAANQRLWVSNALNGIDILDLSSPGAPTLFTQLDFSSFGAVNSVAIHGDEVAVAIENGLNKQVDGMILRLNTDTTLKGFTAAGALPDMVTFSPDGSKILVANEGEPSDDYTVDPNGSVTIIDAATNATITASFVGLDPSKVQANSVAGRPDGVRVFGPGADLAADLEPEYIAVSEDGSKAYVSLQENNALAVVDIATGTVENIFSYGLKDYGDTENPIDASNKDSGINIQTQPNVFGIYQPDAISTFTKDGMDFIVTANEGDARDYDGFSEEFRVKDLKDALAEGLYTDIGGIQVALTLDATAFPDADILDDENLGRLKTTFTRWDSDDNGVINDKDAFVGDLDVDGDIDEIYSYGARSFSIWKVTPTGLEQVFDSADDFEQITASILGETGFNADEEAGSADDRSDDKGPEPEGVTIATIDSKTYAFIGLERVGGIMVYDITDPTKPAYIEYVNPRDFSALTDDTQGDVAPEGLIFIDGADRPDGKSLLVVTNEVSGTTSIYEVSSVPTPAAAGLGLVGLATLALRRRQNG